MISYKAIILTVSSLFLMNCNAQKNKSKIKVDTDKTKVNQVNKSDKTILYFNEGENRFLKEYQMNVTFKGISEDSRCPKDVNCIWAGVAVAQIEVMGTATRPMTLEIATIDNKSRNYSASAVFNGYTISLADVQPYPRAVDGAKALKGKYRIGIIITKASDDSTMK